MTTLGNQASTSYRDEDPGYEAMMTSLSVSWERGYEGTLAHDVMTALVTRPAFYKFIIMTSLPV